ncbi:insulin receptor substrate 2-B [Neoarius graeffei]|uniref:insulin receptor substrate 2-B n=1 Tax=Neoarius graeffei TaxID=443677 RepID=UPI00298CE088|nr:insulin receptor substrate 2-B [Neoarius graeffei]
MEDLQDRGVMLTPEAPPRRVVVKTAALATSGEPSSSSSSSCCCCSINNGGSRSAAPHPPAGPPRRLPPPYHFRVHHVFPEESAQDPALRRHLPALQYKVHDSAFCRVLSTDTTAAALAAAAAVCSGSVDADVWKCGYLRKQKHGHRRFFVLRGPGALGPSRLEYYDSEKKFRTALKAAAGAVCPPKRVIYLSQCFTVNKRADAKNKYLIALYTKDEYFAMVADSEQEQEDWYLALTELMTEGKKGQLDTDELDDGYGTISPGTIFKEVWQVNVKPKGLGQTKNLMGVYRLCLSAKTIHLVKLNSETPAVNLPLMNIRRCGHSESFFFIEVGRSSSIGPGEIWVQVEDSVVAQNMHETILDTMKALKAFPDFRPRSKSQSSGSNPIPFITTRRQFGNLPPSQAGLQRASRTDSVTGIPPTGKNKGVIGQRYRTSSEGEGTSDRPLSSGTGSLLHLNTPCLNVGREESGGCCAHASPGSVHHTRSASLPVSHFLSATSPISVSSSSGHGSASDTHTRPSSSSICGSPSDGGFNSSDEFCPSPCDFRYFRASSSTPEPHSDTPPIREDYRLADYMAMDWYKDTQGGARTFEEESSYMERTFLKLAHYAKPKPANSLGGVHQKATQTSSSLDESSPVESKRHAVCSCLLKTGYKSYSELHHPNRPPSLISDGQKKLPKDDGYMPMIYSVVPSHMDYTPMQPRANHVATLHLHPDRHGYMMMLPPRDSPSPGITSPSSRSQNEYDDYIDMSQICSTESYRQASPEGPKVYGSYFSLPRSYKTPCREDRRKTEYVPESPVEPQSPSSPGEYIHMEFGDGSPHAASPPSAVDSPSMPSSQPCHQLCCSPPDHDYMGLNMDNLLKNRPPRHSLVAPWNPPNYARPLGCTYGQVQNNFVPKNIHREAESPSRMIQHLCVSERSPSPRTEPKVIRADPQGRRRHSSETFYPSAGGSVGGCAARSSAVVNLVEGCRWQNSASFDSVWSYTEDQGSTDSVLLSANCATGGTCCNVSSSYLNYIALDLREVPRIAHDATPPRPAHGTLEEGEACAGLDLSKSGGHTTASKE